MREELSNISYRTYQLEEIVDEMVSDRLQSFKQMFVGDRVIENIILVDDYVSLILQKGILKSGKEGHVDMQTFHGFVDKLKRRNSQEIASALGIPAENTSLLYLSATMIKHMMKVLGAKTLWAPGVSLCDGIAYEYAFTTLRPVPSSATLPMTSAVRELPKPSVITPQTAATAVLWFE